jgi:hypothetical protein
MPWKTTITTIQVRTESGIQAGKEAFVMQIYPFAANRLAFLWLLRAPGASHWRLRPRDSRSRMICD